MGTRNKTRVILDGEIIINQYCQWDGHLYGNGYGAGAEIVHYLKENLDNLENLKTILRTKISPLNYEYINSRVRTRNKLQKIYYSQYLEPTDKNSPIYKKDIKIEECRDYAQERMLNDSTWLPSFSDLLPEVKRRFLEEKYGVKDTCLFYMSSRDTGWKVLETIEHYSNLLPGIPVFKQDTDGFDIEGIYEINLDDNTLTMTYHGFSKTFSFKKLPSDKYLKNKEKEIDD